MKRYLIDTGPLGAYLHNRKQAVEIMVPWITDREAATSILVYAEIVEYIKGLPHYNHRHVQLRELLNEISPYFLTYPILERYADIRRKLRPPNGPGLIGDIDTLIAATAIERNLTLVTMDTDFQRVPGLKLILLSKNRSQ